MKLLLAGILLVSILNTSPLNEKGYETLVDGLVERFGHDRVKNLLEQVQEKVKTGNPLVGFVPNGKVEQYITAIGKNNEKWIFVLSAANKVGKTSGTINVLGNLIWGIQNPWFQGERFENWKHPRRFWYVSEHETLKKVVTGVDGVNGEIIKWFPKGRYTLTKGSREFYSHFVADNGWTGEFLSYDQDLKQFESDNIGVLILDEPAPEAIFNAGLARLLAGGGIVLVPMTPLTHSAWVFDRLLDKTDKESGVAVFYADVEENCLEHGTRGIIPHENISRIVEMYDEEEVAARAHGKPTHLAGLVYKNLHPDTHKHSVPASDFTQDKHQIYCVCDPHDAKPPLLGWAAIDTWGICRFVYEFPNLELGYKPFHQIKRWTLTTDQVAEKVKEIEEGMHWDPKKIIRIMDPNFGKKPSQATGLTVRDQFAEGGAKIGWPMWFSTDVIDKLDAGHRRVRDRLWINGNGETRLIFGENCTNIRYDMARYSYDPRRGRSLERHGEGEAVAMKFKDGADIVRYLVMYVYGPMVEEKKEEEPKDWTDFMNMQSDKMLERSYTGGIR